LPIRIVSPPLIKSPAAWWVNVAVELAPVLTLAVTETGFSLAEIEGVATGSASGKLMLPTPNVNVALGETVAFIVKGRVLVAWANAPPAIVKTKPKTIVNPNHFFIFNFLLFMNYF
jgi:hypothetical protein